MAKWGEGDPRWIVEERPDATNVNNWHWTEKNACGWSKDKLKELLEGLKLKNDVADCKISSINTIEGEAVVNNRKGKLIFFYEWDITLKWKGKLVGGDTKCSGEIHIPNLSEENSISEIDIEVSLKESSPEGDIVKDYLRHQGADVIREKLGLYVSLLKEEFSKGLILPTKGNEDQESKDQQISNLSSGFNKVHVNNTTNSKSSKKSSSGDGGETGSITVSNNFQCTASDFFKAMTDVQMAKAWTNGPVVLDPRKGGHFELFGGNIQGEFLDFESNKKIIQRWRLKNWPDGHYSIVSLELDQHDSETTVKLVQTGVPISEVDSTRENWNRYYWESIKRVFGWGFFL